MSGIRELREGLLRLTASGKDNAFIALCSVDSVDLSTMTCNVTSQSEKVSVSIPNVNLQAVPGDGVVHVPVLESLVIVSYTIRGEPYLLLCSDIQEYIFWIKNEDETFSGIHIKNDGNFTLNDGSFGGLIIIAQLMQSLNNLEKKTNSIIDYLKTQVLPVSGANAGPPVGFLITDLTLSEQENLENKRIKHGI